MESILVLFLKFKLIEISYKKQKQVDDVLLPSRFHVDFCVRAALSVLVTSTACFCLLELILINLNSKNSQLHFIRIFHISAIDRDRSDENIQENAKDIRISNCPEYEAKIALSQN